MLDFNEEEFVSQVASAVALRPQIEAAVDTAIERGLSNIFFVGAGGTWANDLPYELLFQTHSKFPARAVIAKEFILLDEPSFDSSSVAIFSSVSGTTEDVVEAIRFAKSKGALTIGFTGYPESPIATEVDIPLISEPKAWPFDVQLILFSTYFLSTRGEFAGYEKLAAELVGLPKILVSVAEQVDPIAEAHALAHADTDYYFLVGAGNLWGYTYLYSMCVLEEMQWLKTSRVHAAEFFHGALELIEKDTSLLLFFGEDQSRPLMERVRNFATQYSDDIEVIDTKDYALEGISEEFRWLVSPSVVDTICHRYRLHLARVRDHALDIRRYYRVVAY